MTKTYKEPQAYETEARPQIPMNPVESHKIGAIGYDPETSTLAVRFARGVGAIYHYPGITADTARDFMAAESKGKFFGAVLQDAPFKKYPAE